MKSLIVLAVGLLAVGCVGPKEHLNLRNSVVGEYELKHELLGTLKLVFLENSGVDSYLDGEKERAEYKWSISNKEIHIIDAADTIWVYSINTDKSIIMIASLPDGKRTDFSKDIQWTYKKIK